MEDAALEPRRIWWARPRKLCALERPGGGGRNHRAARRAAEIAWLRGRGVRIVVSVMRSRHNLTDYEAAGLDWHHVPVRRPQDEPDALEELLPLLRAELRRRGRLRCTGTATPTSSPPSAPRTCTRPAAPIWPRRSTGPCAPV